MRATPILFIFFAGNAFATSDGRSNDPSRLDFANTAAFRGMLERGDSTSSKARIAMWTPSPDLSKAEVVVAVPPRAPSKAELVLEEIVPRAAPSEAITTRTVRYASIDDNPRRHASRHKRRQPLSTPSADDDQGEPSLLQKIFGALFQGD